MKSLIKSSVGRISTTAAFLMVIILSLLILRQVGIVKAQADDNITELNNSDTSLNETYYSNQTDLSGNNSTVITSNENLTNETFENNTSETLENNTNQTNVTFTNETSNETLQENITEEIPTEIEEPKGKPNFVINIDYPKRMTRGETINVKANAVNTGSAARNVVLIWNIPQGFEIVSGNDREFCGNLESTSSCSSLLELKTDVSTPIGLNEIKVVMNYEE
jgi:archaellum component FlaF (FlaF/FlaG flagellin family)